MKRYALYILAAIAFVSCTQDLEEQIAVTDNGGSCKAVIVDSATDAVRGEMIVKFRPEAEPVLERVASRSGATRSGVEGVDAILESIGATSVKRVFNVTERNREAVHAAGLHLWYALCFDTQADLERVASQLSEVAEVGVVQYSARVKRVNNRKAVAASEPRIATRASQPFNDPYLAEQWHYINNGDKSVTSPSKAGADVGCAGAWELCTGDPSVVVAVVDEGVQYSHPDLSANMWVNEAEQNGKRGVDDDGNGYVDDIYGYNFVVGHWSTSSVGDISWDASGDTGHGTHVAGTIAAVNGNGTGVCGIAGGTGGGNGARIMSCQIFSGENGATTENTAKAIQYAADNGSVILQCSWGYYSANTEDIPTNEKGPSNDLAFGRWYSVEKEAIDYFIANAGSESGPVKGGLAIFAGGNEYASLPGYPAGYEPCISVSAIAADFTPSTYTNYGPGTDIAAPGGDSDYAKGAEGAILSLIPTVMGNYGYMEGTSMACPHVSGVAALGLSYAAKLGKHYTASEFRSMLLSSVDDINQYLTGTKHYYYYYSEYGTAYPESMSLSSYNGNMGSGLTDAWRLLLQVEGTPCITVKADSQIASTIDPAPCFGGSTSVKIKSVTVSEADKEAVGMTTCTVSQNKIYVVCTKPGIATMEVTALVGGSVESSTTKPIDTKITKRIALVVRDGSQATNGGWL